MNARQSTYRYPVASLVPDGLRALVGLAFTGVPLAMLPVATWFGAVLGVGVVLFGLFGALTVLRVRAEVRVDDDGIEVEPGRGRIRWDGLRAVKLRYFAVRRERERAPGAGRRHGWMQLVLRGERQVVRLDSRLDGFEEVLSRVAVAAAHLSLDPVTRANFEAAGLQVVEPREEERSAASGSTAPGER